MIQKVRENIRSKSNKAIGLDSIEMDRYMHDDLPWKLLYKEYQCQLYALQLKMLKSSLMAVNRYTANAQASQEKSWSMGTDSNTGTKSIVPSLQLWPS